MAGQGLNVVMPVYNEQATVYRIIRRVLGQGGVGKLVVVYDTRSTDSTLWEIKRAIKGDARALLVSKRLNGKGSSVIEGLKHIRSGPVIIQDADEEYYPEDYPKLLGALVSGQPVFGYRQITVGKSYSYMLGALVGRATNILFNLLFRQSVRDVNACYKLFTKEMLGGRELTESGFGIDMQIASSLAKNGYKIQSVPIRYKGRTWEEGKKTGFRDGIGLFLAIIKARLAT